TSLLIPDSRAFPDSDDLLAEALTALARAPTPTAREILVSLAVPRDETRCCSAAPAAPGRAPPSPTEDDARPPAPRTPLDAVPVAPAPGGRRLTAFVPVSTGRTLAVRLHHALYAAREAIDYRRATGSPDAFDTAVAAGVSHDLTEALITLVQGTEGARIAVAWAPAAGPPDGCAAGAEPVEFSPGDLPALREAGARYRHAEPSVPVRITGAVVRMHRPGPRGGGTVRLRVLAGAELGSVRLSLGEADYRTAGQAHLAGLPVRVRGRLESRGGFRRLTGVEAIE